MVCFLAEKHMGSGACVRTGCGGTVPCVREECQVRERVI